MSRPVDPRSRALQMNSGSQISALLAPVRPASKGSGAPNHALANRQALKAAQVRNALKRTEDEAKAAEEPFKMARFKGVESVLRQKSVDGTLGLGAPRMDDDGSAAAAASTRRGVSSQGRRAPGGLTSKMGGMSLNGRDGPGSAARMGSRGGAGGGIAAMPRARLDMDDDGGAQMYSQPHRGQQQYSDEEGGDDGAQFDDEGRGFDDEADQGQYSRGRTQQFDDDGEEEDLAGLMAGRGGMPSHQQQQQSHYQSGGSRGGIDSVRVPSSLQSGHAAATEQQGGRSFVAENAKKVIAASRQLASARGNGPDDASRGSSRGADGFGTTSSGSAPRSAKHSDYGKVPQYIQDQKAAAAAAKEAASKQQQEKDLGIPAGMILMPEDQRLQILAVLNENHGKVLNELAAFPLRVETNSRRKAKADLEAKLEEIEKALTLFSRKRVLIQP